MASQYQTAVLIHNPQAGRSRRKRAGQIQRAIEELERAGVAVTMRPTAGPGSGSHLAREAVRAGAELIVVCGGDGTINEVVNGMAKSQVPLAVLPAGTANVLARELQLPCDIVSAARAIRSATARRISLGLARGIAEGAEGGRYFLLMAGVGFDAQVLYELNLRHKDFLGMAAYALETIRQMLSRRPVPFIFSAEGRRHQVTFACISKTRHYGPFPMVREADIFSDRFYVYCFHSESSLRYWLYSLAVLAGQPAQLPDFSRFPARKIQCDAVPSQKRKVFFQVDGELVGTLPCTVEIVRDALTLLAPPHSRDPAAGR